MTNYERLSKDKNEMAEFLLIVSEGHLCEEINCENFGHYSLYCNDHNCLKCVKKWLESEIKE